MYRTLDRRIVGGGTNLFNMLFLLFICAIAFVMGGLISAYSWYALQAEKKERLKLHSFAYSPSSWADVMEVLQGSSKAKRNLTIGLVLVLLSATVMWLSEYVELPH